MNDLKFTTAGHYMKKNERIKEHKVYLETYNSINEELIEFKKTIE